MTDGSQAALRELDRQLRTLRDLDYPKLAGLEEGAFDELVAPLRDRVQATRWAGHPGGGPAEGEPDLAGAIPLLVVVKGALVPTVDQVERWSVRGRAGWTDMRDELAGFGPVEGVDVPDSPVYLLLDVDTGADTLGVTPNDALPRITGAGRTPLTIDEGVALVTQHPQVFATHNAFQALGSRASNKRVPSFWVSKGAPRLGWCWAGNPHSWLGAASAASRS